MTILDRNLPIEQIVTRAPIAVFEILSPEDSINRMMTKLAYYERMGIKTILVLYPNGRHFRYVAERLEPLSPEPFPDLFRIAPAALTFPKSKSCSIS